MKKKKTQLQIDEELAKKLQGEELAQAEAEREATALKKKRAQTKRKPSITKVKQDERRRMVTFLKNALNVNVKMLTSMSFKNLEDLYKKEMKTLQGDTKRRDELERKLKAQHDVQKPFPEEVEREKNVEEQAQGGDEQTRQDAELAKKLQEELDRNVQSEKATDELPNVEKETTADSPVTPTSEKQKNFKRKKMIAKRGPKAKKARVEAKK